MVVEESLGKGRKLYAALMDLERPYDSSSSVVMISIMMVGLGLVELGCSLEHLL